MKKKIQYTAPEMPDFVLLWARRFDHHTQILNYSPRTRENQFSVLRTFGVFLQEKNISDIRSITTQNLMEFQHWLFYRPTWKGTVRALAGQNRILRVIRGFFFFLTSEGLFGRSPALDLRYAREPEQLPRNVLTPQEARKIIETPDTSTLLGYRDRVILEVFYATGIRKSELLNLMLEDVNLEEELLRINEGKGGKDRVVPLSRIACSLLESYIKGVRPELLKTASSRLLFISARAKPISRSALGHVVEKYARMAGIKKHVTCHLWRHSCATHLLKNKANLRHVQEMLGHRSLATTERYLSLTITDLKEAHRRCHPREKED